MEKNQINLELISTYLKTVAPKSATQFASNWRGVYGIDQCIESWMRLNLNYSIDNCIEYCYINLIFIENSEIEEIEDISINGKFFI